MEESSEAFESVMGPSSPRQASPPPAIVEDAPEPVVIQFRDVTAAAYRIKKGVKETPLEVCVSEQHTLTQ